VGVERGCPPPRGEGEVERGELGVISVGVGAVMMVRQIDHGDGDSQLGVLNQCMGSFELRDRPPPRESSSDVAAAQTTRAAHHLPDLRSAKTEPSQPTHKSSNMSKEEASAVVEEVCFFGVAGTLDLAENLAALHTDP